MPHPVSEKGHILIVDDEENIQLILDEWFKAEEYHTTAVGNGREALEVLGQEHVHLVVCDLMMPELDGRGVLKGVKAKYPDIEVILMTAAPSVEAAVAAMKEGAYDFIQKPLVREELVALAEKALEKRKLKNILSVYRASQDVFKTMSLETLLPITVHLAAEALGADDASIMLVNTQNILEVAATHGLGDDERMTCHVALGERVAGRVFETKEPVLIAGSLGEDSRFKDVPQLRTIRSAIVNPIIIDGVPLGVLNFNRTAHKDPYGEADLAAAQIVCSQIGLAIRNAQLFAAVKDDQQALSAVFNQIFDPIILVDASGIIVVCNEISIKYFGAEAKPGTSVYPRLADLEMEPQFLSLLASPETVIHFEAVRRKPKLLMFSGTATGVRLEALGLKGGTTGKLLVFRDVTHERSVNQQKYTFLALISHKFRTPLTSIMGYADLLAQDRSLEKEPLRFAQSTLRQAHKLADLVEKMLRFIELEELETRDAPSDSFSIVGAISAVIEKMKPWLESYGASAKIGLTQGEIVTGNAALIKDVIQNLVENAVKFNPKPEKKVTIWTESASREATVFIRDNGAGIPPEDQERILGGFYQSEKFFTGQVEGLGLGLAFVSRVVKYHGGKLSLKSDLDQGTLISFTLPRKAG